MLIFNLHHIEPPSTLARYANRRQITISPQGLRRFIQTLRLAGMEIISMREALANGLGDPSSKKDTSRQVVLTIDDGFENNLIYAAPVLEAEKCPATIFVLPGRFGGTNEWDQGDWAEADRDKLMTLEQMQGLGQSGYVTFGSHGMLHRPMPKLDKETLHYELHASHEILNRELGDMYLPVLAYPWGYYSESVLEMMPDSPYHCAFTVEKARWEPGTPVYEIPRYSVYHRDGNPLVILAKLARHGLLPVPFFPQAPARHKKVVNG